MENIFNYKRNDLEDYLISIGGKKFNATQIFEWIYQKQVCDFKEMSNVNKELITKLSNNFSFDLPIVVKEQKSKETSKYLLKLSDDSLIEAVLMHHDYGYSLCVSSQIGCNMGCSFCESGRLKKVRNLETHEMVSQVLLVGMKENVRISSVVIMGIGEPFDNYENVINFIKIINDDKALAIGARHITVSTCGIIPKIEEFSKESFQVNLAISLHAPNDKLRSEIMPINNAYHLKDLIECLKCYIAKTNRRVTFEYIMLDSVNDTEECALELCKLIRGMNAYVNLIPYNETSHIKYRKSNMVQIMKFYDILKKNKINVTIRKKFGDNIDAACGQLRAKGANL